MVTEPRWWVYVNHDPAAEADTQVREKKMELFMEFNRIESVAPRIRDGPGLGRVNTEHKQWSAMYGWCGQKVHSTDRRGVAPLNGVVGR